MTRLGIISAFPDEDWHARRIVRAASARARAEVLSPFDFAADVSEAGTAIAVRGEPHRAFDAFLTPRPLGEAGDHELQIELYRALAEEGAILVNEVDGLLAALDKLRTSVLLARAAVPTPRARVIQRAPELQGALAALGGRAVTKPLYGSLGEGVELCGPGDVPRLEARIAEGRSVYLQAFVEGDGGDLRAFVVGGRVAAAMRRVARPGEFRANMHLGARGEPASLSRAAAAAAVRAAAVLGLDYAGVDLVETEAGPVVLEVNGTPLFRGILEATGLDMAEVIVEHALARAAARGSRGRHRSKARVEKVAGPTV